MQTLWTLGQDFPFLTMSTMFASEDEIDLCCVFMCFMNIPHLNVVRMWLWTCGPLKFIFSFLCMVWFQCLHL